MGKQHKEALPAGRVEGLSVAAVASPFEGLIGTLLDLRGPWTEGLLERWIDLPPGELDQPVGVAVWTGVATVTFQADTHAIRVLWEGSWRPLSEDELAALGNGDRPLTMTSFPPADELLPLPGAT